MVTDATPRAACGVASLKQHLIPALAALLMGAMLASVGTPTAHAAAFTVNTQTDAVDASPGDGLCATAALPGEGIRCTLRAAIMEANALAGPDQVNLPPGTYRTTILGGGEDAAAKGDLDITSDLTLAGAGRDATFIDGNSSISEPADRVLDVLPGGRLTVTDLTIQHATLAGGPGGGAGIRNRGIVTLSRSVITGTGGFLARPGGGIYTTGTMTISDSVITRNGTNSGAGGGISNSGTLTVVNTTISENSAFGYSHDMPYGGGIDNHGSLVLAGVTISNNRSVFGGGGLYNVGQATVTNSTFSGNMTYTSEATNLVNDGSGHLTLTNTTIYANGPSISYGSGLYAGTGIDNRAIDIRGLAIDVPLTNTIVANSGTGTNCSGGIASNGYNLETGTSCQLTQPTDHPGTDPELRALADNGGPTQTHALLAGSPAIDAGTNIGCQSTDQRGRPRPLDGSADGTLVCDIGAYEAPAGSVVLRCAISPRPPVQVVTSPDGAGHLAVTVRSNGAGNHLDSLAFTTRNAAVDIVGEVGRTGSFTIPLPTQPQGVLFTVRRLAPGAATVQLIVTDSCGPWPTFVGLGAGGP